MLILIIFGLLNIGLGDMHGVYGKDQIEIGIAMVFIGIIIMVGGVIVGVIL
jgi:hypothetical protein